MATVRREIECAAFSPEKTVYACKVIRHAVLFRCDTHDSTGVDEGRRYMSNYSRDINEEMQHS